MIKIRELLQQYPILDDPKPLIRVLATACQVFHDIQIQVDQFKVINMFLINYFQNKTIIKISSRTLSI